MWNVEYTDTFGGESNYSWVERKTIKPPPNATNATIMRHAKAAVGLSGVRGRTVSYGDMLEFRPYRMARVLFVMWAD
jgi:hypothetical protein